MRERIDCCGLDCEKCDAYIASRENNAALREKTARKVEKIPSKARRICSSIPLISQRH